MQSLINLGIPLSFLFLASCSASTMGTISSNTNLSSPAIGDVTGSLFTTQVDRVPADDISVNVVSITVKDNSGQFVVNAQPTLDFSSTNNSNSTVKLLSCSSSNVSGVSLCLVRGSAPGTYTYTVNFSGISKDELLPSARTGQVTFTNTGADSSIKLKLRTPKYEGRDAAGVLRVKSSMKLENVF